MAEVYPSDSELLNIVSETETGVEYIPTGQAPYYLEFRKLLYRLLLASRRANDLRVFDEGDLNIGVKSGKFWVGTSLVSYGGSSGNTLADDKANIYIYLDSAGSLVTNEYTAFPGMASEVHVRLAVVTTSGGDITSIADARDHHNMSIPSAGQVKTVEAHTGDDTLTEAESGSVHTNLGAAGTITLTLPASAAAGTAFTFCVQAAQQLRVDPQSATIRDNNGQTPDKYKWADAVGECLTLVADANGDWATTAKNGTWSEQT
ncbi:MAG: hypothetical protein ACYTFK_01295 [Planctomycetota bacterium]|jgi:hypothetical protein